eukprot:10988583-Heterocapsa_arctica.AAC.1
MPARPPRHAPPHAPDYHSTYSPANTPDRTLSPVGVADRYVPPRHKQPSFLGHMRPPPPRPPVPPFNPNIVQQEEQPWCETHQLRGDPEHCWRCGHVRDWWRCQLIERGN